MANTIKIKSYANVQEEMVTSGAAILYPGHLVEMTNASNGKTVQKHSDAGGIVYPMVILENELEGKLISDAAADATANLPVQVWIPQRGEIAYMRPAHGNAIAIGDFVESAGDGEIQKYIADLDSSNATFGNLQSQNQIIGQALEAHSAVASDGADTKPLIMIRIL